MNKIITCGILVLFSIPSICSFNNKQDYVAFVEKQRKELKEKIEKEFGSEEEYFRLERVCVEEAFDDAQTMESLEKCIKHVNFTKEMLLDAIDKLGSVLNHRLQEMQKKSSSLPNETSQAS